MGILELARDAWDVVRRARGPLELARAALPSLASPIILNDAAVAPGPLAAETLFRELRGARNELRVAGLADGRVNYRGLASAPALRTLTALAPSLQALGPAAFTDDAERVAWFIDLYNVLAIHGVIALGIEESVMEVPSFFGRVSYRVGGAVLSLDAIENGVLRRNAPHPFTRKPVLPPDSPGLAFCPATVDPRIHAALVCGAASCPPVAFYDPEVLDEQLELAAGNYVDANTQVGDGELVLPITYKYYAADWGGAEEIEAFLLRHASPRLREQLEALFRGAYAVRYARYDWTLNAIV